MEWSPGRTGNDHKKEKKKEKKSSRRLLTRAGNANSFVILSKANPQGLSASSAPLAAKQVTVKSRSRAEQLCVGVLTTSAQACGGLPGAWPGTLPVWGGFHQVGRDRVPVGWSAGANGHLYWRKSGGAQRNLNTCGRKNRKSRQYRGSSFGCKAETQLMQSTEGVGRM